jgi:peptidoglycan pentaglycine glycine transferase (the second and third glycine)
MFTDSYYKTMKETYGDHLKVLLASIRPAHLLEALEKEKEQLDAEKAEIEAKLAETPGSRKFLKKQKVNEEALEINAKKQAEANELRAQHGEEIQLASALFTVYDNECVYYLSAAEEQYRNYFGPYAIQWYMLKWCTEHNVNRYNFYGISGVFKEDAEDYGVYEFKKGFGGRVEQMVGDFILVLNRPLYALYEKIK